MPLEKILVAFDFDHTIIDDNSDTHVVTLCPDGVVPEGIKEKFTTKGWTHYMGAIFQYLHENGVTQSDIRNCMHQLPFTDGMKELLTYLQGDKFDVIIISDSNSLFIQYFLEYVNLTQAVNAVYTNPAKFDCNDCLTIEFYHVQDWCDLSTENLCKGDILETHIEQQVSQGVVYKRVLYVGDGTNDLCPALKLRKEDYVCARKDFRLWKKLKSCGLLGGEASDIELKANILCWDSGNDILKLVKEIEHNG